MPKLCEWVGILFYIYNEVKTSHHSRHFHVKYGEHRASYDIDSGERLAGSFPRRQEKIVLKILKEHKQELINFWENEQSSDPVTPRPTFRPRM